MHMNVCLSSGTVIGTVDHPGDISEYREHRAPLGGGAAPSAQQFPASDRHRGPGLL
jgi:hypothetical protein